MALTGDKKILEDLLSKEMKIEGTITDIRSVRGGSINTACEFRFGDALYFLKENSVKEFPQMFLKERNGLKELMKCKELKVPAPVLLHETESTQYLVMEHLEKNNSRDHDEALGRGLAALHAIKGKSFGFYEDNYIGSLQQSNGSAHSWPVFLAMQRLHPLVKWCYDEKLLSRLQLRSFETLYERLAEIFPPEEPCLLHGDLWNGNVMSTTKGPAIFDPAVYYGHREMDLAMSRLFGGFGEGFYRAYDVFYPLEKDHPKRVEICNLYPLLVHVKLFGSGYLQDVVSIIKKF